MDRTETRAIIDQGRNQLLADFPMTSSGLRLPGRNGPFEYGWLAIATMIGLAVPTLLAVAVQAPLVFPPLASTALMVTAQSQRLNAQPRAAILGHGCGVVSGLIVGYLLGTLRTAGSISDMTWIHGVAALVTVGVCLSLMAVIGVAHAPALSTALMIGLGLLTQVSDMAVLIVGVVLLTYTLALVHHRAKVFYPWWARDPDKLPKPNPEAL